MDQENHIDGIYNYCDRWCERCAFTTRCQVFTSEHLNLNKPTHDADSPEFWNEITHNFEDTLQMLQNLMEKLEDHEQAHGGQKDDNEANGENEGTTPPFQEYEDEDDDDEDAAEGFDDPFQRQRPDWPDQYHKWVQEFFTDNEDYFHAQEYAFEERISKGLPIDVEELGFLHEALYTIRWYEYLIGAKIHRALSDLIDNENGQDDFQGDGNGSAKIAMISIQKSQDAWEFVEHVFPDKALEIGFLKRTLQVTRTKLVEAYPNWEKFHRPGFDDEPDTIIRLDFNPN